MYLMVLMTIPIIGCGGLMVTEGKQFLDFIDRIDQKYDSSVKQIFLVLDNVSQYTNQTK
jgi:hypothetical protein